jgi:hypothetical protein
LKVQTGNCFDYSVLLVSLLRGFGYDAYVVSGYANRDITILDETKTESDAAGVPSATKENNLENTEFVKNDSNSANSDKITSKYKIKPPRQLKSMFLLKQEEKRKALAKEAERKKLESEKSKAVRIDIIIIIDV